MTQSGSLTLCPFLMLTIIMPKNLAGTAEFFITAFKGSMIPSSAIGAHGDSPVLSQIFESQRRSWYFQILIIKIFNFLPTVCRCPGVLASWFFRLKPFEMLSPHTPYLILDFHTELILNFLRQFFFQFFLDLKLDLSPELRLDFVLQAFKLLFIHFRSVVATAWIKKDHKFIWVWMLKPYALSPQNCQVRGGSGLKLTLLKILRVGVWLWSINTVLISKCGAAFFPF